MKQGAHAHGDSDRVNGLAGCEMIEEGEEVGPWSGYGHARRSARPGVQRCKWGDQSRYPAVSSLTRDWPSP